MTRYRCRVAGVGVGAGADDDISSPSLHFRSGAPAKPGVAGKLVKPTAVDRSERISVSRSGLDDIANCLRSEARTGAGVDAWTVGQNVATTSGNVIAHAAADAIEVSEYLGIPYATPPTGPLRFQRPVEFNGSYVINATDFGFACLQPGDGGQNSVPQSEDCLTLNIWTKPQVGERKKAILVWVHGGAYSFGSSRAPGYNGEYISNQTDVLSSGHFGFPGNPVTASNLGLLDMRLAIHWIRNNAAAFGGDVNRITIFGQSAGASMADFYSYSYASDPIANGFILMSATVDGFPVATASRWLRIAETAGCGASTTDPNLITECMRSKTARELISALSSEDTGIGAVPAFRPGVDDIIIFADYSSQYSASGGYLIGNNQNEAGLLTRSTGDGNPSWRYRYFGDFPNLTVSADLPSGAYHGAELQPLFDTVPHSPIPSTSEEVAIGDYLRSAWAAFSKDPAHGLLSYEDGWPKYEPTEETLVRLAFGNKTGTNLALGNAYDGPCHFLERSVM
ncbi:carboxylesterase [Dactylonectria macrodidyma]|uniref:Carboxylic ester hydrolase n=1 Tax=Dactylonectria macrodidyma TaxID=307937 RepID=A0A9P9FP82_9HYPO|nr:carboxylesterase [Dactylonectria macrodidyma]